MFSEVCRTELGCVNAAHVSVGSHGKSPPLGSACVGSTD